MMRKYAIIVFMCVIIVPKENRTTSVVSSYPLLMKALQSPLITTAKTA